MKLLISYGADIDTKDEDGFTLLHIASINGRTDYPQTLLQYRLNIDEPDNNGQNSVGSCFN
jgi:ankyrin repeat protein